MIISSPMSNDIDSVAIHSSLVSDESAIRPVVAWGGDVNLGRRQHYRTAELGIENVLKIPALQDADLSIANLECVIATVGEQGVKKGEGGPYYYRARPEMLSILMSAGIDIVATANNHAGDYGPGAIVEQCDWLNRVGVGYAGSGENLDKACTPIFRRAGNLNIAVFSIDATMCYFAATYVRPGIFYISIKNPSLWQKLLAPQIFEARKKAHIVLVAVHWGANSTSSPTQEKIVIGHTIIDAGADAVLGASAHCLQGIEIYKNRPIIHDAGDLLFDSDFDMLRDSGVFQLELSHAGVQRVRFVPIEVGFGYSLAPEGDAAVAACQRFAKICEKMGTKLLVTQHGNAYIDFEPENRPWKHLSPAPLTEYKKVPFHAHFKRVDSRWQVDEVPEDARIDPVRLGLIILVGLRLNPLVFIRRQMLWIESFWRCDAPIDENLRLEFRGIPVTPTKMEPWGKGMDHDPCDWMRPTTTWTPGIVYRDYYGLRPPYLKNWDNTNLQIAVNVISKSNLSNPEVIPFFVKLSIKENIF